MIEIIRNQPIQALPDVLRHAALPEYDLMQLVQKNDVQLVMVKRTPHLSEAVISPMSFSIAGGMDKTLSSLTSTGAGDASVATAIVINATYKISLRVFFTQFDPTGGYRIKLNNEWLTLPDAGAGAYSILSGTVEAYLDIPGSVTSSNLTIEVTGADNIVSFSSIRVERLSEIQVTVLDETKTVIQTLAGVVTNYNDSPFSHITIDWSTITGTGIRYLRINDSLNLNTDYISNGTFTSDIAGWTNVDGSATAWVWEAFAGGRAHWDDAGTTDQELSQEVNVPGGGYYELAFTVSAIDFNDGEGLEAYFIVNGVALPLTTFTLTGPYTMPLDLTEYTGNVSVKVVFQPLNDSDTIFLDTVSLKRKYDRNISVPFNLQNNHPFTLLMYGECEAPAFGFPFGNFFYLKMRAKGEMQYLAYPDKTEWYDFSNNETDLLEANRGKTHRVKIHGVEEYIHDAITAMILCDTFTIDGKEYVRDASYELEPTEGIYKASGKFDVREKIGIAANYY